MVGLFWGSYLLLCARLSGSVALNPETIFGALRKYRITREVISVEWILKYSRPVGELFLVVATSLARTMEEYHKRILLALLKALGCEESIR